MNPDIQRIAEKWLDDFLGDCRLTFGMDETEKCLLLERFQEALTELSALRDTQEREQLDSIRLQGENLRNLMEAAHHGWMKERVKTSSLLGKIHDLRTELARRDEEIMSVIPDGYLVAYETTVSAVKAMKDGLMVYSAENASLRSRIGELEAKYGVQEQLDHVFGQLPSNEDT